MTSAPDAILSNLSLSVALIKPAAVVVALLYLVSVAANVISVPDAEIVTLSPATKLTSVVVDDNPLTTLLLTLQLLCVLLSVK